MTFKPTYTSQLPSKSFLSKTPQEPLFRYAAPLEALQVPIKLRSEGVYLAGNPGYGKSSLLQHMILADIRAGRGVCVIDPTADLVNTIVHWIPEHRAKDTICFDTQFATPIDFFSYNDRGERDVLHDQLTQIFALENAPLSQPKTLQVIGTLFDANDNGGQFTFFDIDNFIKYEDTRKRVFKHAPHREKEFKDDKFSPSDYKSITGRMLKFNENPTLKAIVNAKPKTGINISEIMRKNQILLVNLQDSSTDQLIGALITAKFQQAAFARRSIREEYREPYCLYIDECQTIIKYGADDFSKMLTRARKYNLCLTLANQLPDDDDLPSKIQQKLPMITTRILFNLDNPSMFKQRIGKDFIEIIPTLPKFKAVFALQNKVSVVDTPRFLGRSPASYAESIRKRTVDTTDCNSDSKPHDEVNGQSDKGDDIAPSGSAKIQME